MADDIVIRQCCDVRPCGCADARMVIDHLHVVIERLRALLGHACKNLTACEVENDEMNEDIIRLLTEVGRLRAAGDALAAAYLDIWQCRGIGAGTIQRTYDAWLEARRG